MSASRKLAGLGLATVALSGATLALRRALAPLPMALAGRTAVITGAASGIGRGIARALARQGCHLALVDRNAGPLEALAGELRGGPDRLRISTHVVDVTDAAANVAMRDAVVAAHHEVDLLFNNAGVALGGDFARVSAAEFDWLLGINLDAVVDLTRLFLPLLRAGDDSALVFTSSLFGLIAPPGQVAYSTSKFAVRGFATALRGELAGTPVSVTVVHPGGVKTAIARDAPLAAALKDDPRAARERAATEKFLRMDPDLAGRIIVDAVRKRRHRVLVGLDAKLLSALERASPVGYPKVMRAVFERASARKTS